MRRRSLISGSVWFAGSLLVAAALVLAWQLISDAGLASPIFFPAPSRIWRALVDGFTNGNMAAELGATAARVFGGWILASAIGISLGASIGISRAARIYIAPSLEVLRPLPVSALVPIFIGFLGYTEEMVLSVIAFGALWPCLLGTIHGFSTVEPRLYEVARAVKLSRLATVMKIALPSALPDIMAGLKVGLTVSLILVVVGEMLGSREGLGYSILLAQRSFHSASVFAGIFLLGIIGYLSAAALDFAERRLIYWR